MPEKKVQLHLYVDREFHDAIVARAKEERRSSNEVMREAIRVYLSFDA